MCSSFFSLHLLPAMLIMIICLQIFWFYWFGFEYILVLFGMRWFSLGRLNFLCIRFLLLSKDIFFYVSLFFFNHFDFHWTQHLALDLVGMYLAAASVWGVTKVSYSSFSLCLSDVFWRPKLVSWSQCISIPNITIGEWRPVILLSFNGFSLISV